eukprot:1497118-Prymnesium_polylepis.1
MGHGTHDGCCVKYSCRLEIAWSLLSHFMPYRFARDRLQSEGSRYADLGIKAPPAGRGARAARARR